MLFKYAIKGPFLAQNFLKIPVIQTFPILQKRYCIGKIDLPYLTISLLCAFCLMYVMLSREHFGVQKLH